MSGGKEGWASRVPQGLKPHSMSGYYGATEVVPLQGGLLRSRELAR